MKIAVLIAICLLKLNFSIAQANIYSIKGFVKNVDSGMIYLVPAISDEKYYNGNYKIDSSTITNGSFVIQRNKIDGNFYAFRFLIRSASENGATDLAFIKPENQVVEIDSIDAHIAPNILHSEVQKEMKSEYNLFFQKFVERLNKMYDDIDELYEKHGNVLPKETIAEIETTTKELSKESDSLFKAYALKHPNSQVTLWKLIERYKNIGYDSNYHPIINMLPDELKNSVAGKSIDAEITQGKVLALGNRFPVLKLENSLGTIINTDGKVLGKSYTLVDFWFLGCGPCRKQFPEFRRLFTKYKRSGFQILGISTDEESELIRWKNYIKSDSLNWYQTIDKAGILTTRMGINSFPTNYLLDYNGIIIRKNISITELELLLRDFELKNMYDKIQSIDSI